MKEVNEKFAQQRKKAAEERQAATKARRKTLKEKNRLAKENEERRNIEQKQRVFRSETALRTPYVFPIRTPLRTPGGVRNRVREKKNARLGDGSPKCVKMNRENQNGAPMNEGGVFL